MAGPVSDIFALPREQFDGLLNELEGAGRDTSDLRRQYRRENSIFSGLYDWADSTQDDLASEGRRGVGGGLLSKDIGATGGDAVGSMRLEPGAFVSGLLGGAGQALDAPAAAARGDMLPQDMIGEALGTAGIAQLGGAAMAAPVGALRSGLARDGDAQYPVAPRDEWYSDANYQTTGGRITEMSPDEFLSRVRPLELDEVARDNIDDLKNHMQSGRTLDPLQISLRGREDGRHRAIAARELGMGSVPVLRWGGEADSVASMLRAGRSENVTDDMMAAVDPQEMFRLYESGATGVDMPMDAASRAARAEGMGFDTGTPLYHGARDPFDRFVPSEDGFTGPGVYTTPSASDASEYAMENRNIGQNMLPVVGKADGFIDQTVFRDAVSNTDGSLDFAAYPIRRQAVGAQMKDEGVTGVDLSNYGENAFGDYGKHLVQRSFFDPSNIRSQFARFDPRLGHLSNLNAANASPMTGLLAAPVAQETQELPFQKFLRGLFQ
ncbi:hypothetical protein DB2_6 [Octadecabacter Antarctic DB virus 2]|nr:hypothetical protein DB2_6 [Octadecabacter Antarctic DB virus 2]